MGGSKPKAPKSETKTVVKQPDAPEPIFFQTIVPKESYEDVEYDINFAQRRAGDLERASDMMGLSPGAIGIQDAATQLRADTAYRASLPTGLEGSIYQTSDKLAADSAANYEQVKKDAAGFDRKYADTEPYKYGPANRDDDWLKFSDAEAEGGGRRRRRRDDDDDDDGKRRRRGKKDDKKDKKDKKRRKDARRLSFYYSPRRKADNYGPGYGRIQRERDPKYKFTRTKRGKIRGERVSNEEYYQKSREMRRRRKSDKRGAQLRAKYISSVARRRRKKKK